MNFTATVRKVCSQFVLNWTFYSLNCLCFSFVAGFKSARLFGFNAETGCLIL